MGQINGTNRAAALATAFAILAFASAAKAHDEEPSAILEFGAASEWSLQHDGSAYGPNIAFEITPIENWLEIEGGMTPFFNRGHTDWDFDLLLKKPFTLSNTVELMIGAGPSLDYATGSGKGVSSVGVEGALDFMIWPWPDRHFGLYLEPSYGYDFSKDHDQSLGVSAGLLVSVP